MRGLGVGETVSSALVISSSAPPRLDAFCASGAWHVLHTRSRQEKALSDELAAMGIANYLPLCRQVRFYGHRKIAVEKPLFPGYVFLRGTIDEAYLADRTRRVAAIMRVADQQTLHWELTNLRLALSNESSFQPHPWLRTGVRVEVRSGPFRGLQGIVQSRTKSDRLILQVRMLGCAASMEIDGALLEILD